MDERRDDQGRTECSVMVAVVSGGGDCVTDTGGCWRLSDSTTGAVRFGEGQRRQQQRVVGRASGGGAVLLGRRVGETSVCLCERVFVGEREKIWV